MDKKTVIISSVIFLIGFSFCCCLPLKDVPYSAYIRHKEQKASEDAKAQNLLDTQNKINSIRSSQSELIKKSEDYLNSFDFQNSSLIISDLEMAGIDPVIINKHKEYYDKKVKEYSLQKADQERKAKLQPAISEINIRCPKEIIDFKRLFHILNGVKKEDEEYQLVVEALSELNKCKTNRRIEYFNDIRESYIEDRELLAKDLQAQLLREQGWDVEHVFVDKEKKEMEIITKYMSPEMVPSLMKRIYMKDMMKLLGFTKLHFSRKKGKRVQTVTLPPHTEGAVLPDYEEWLIATAPFVLEVDKAP